MLQGIEQGVQAGNSGCISDSGADQLCQGCVPSLKVTSVTFQEAIFPILKGSIEVKILSLFFKI